MVLIALLVIAAVCVVLGVVLASVGWLIGSLVASVLAGGLLAYSYLHNRGRAGAAVPAAAGSVGGGPSDVQRDTTTQRDTSTQRNTTKPETERAESAAPAGAQRGAAAGAALGAAASATATRDVLVVDGRPEYHAPGCDRLAGLDAIAIPLEQATEDGFVPCPTCGGGGSVATSTPDAAQAASQGSDSRNGAGAAGTSPADGRFEDGAGMVMVVDGFPEFHAPGCARLAGRDAVEIPLEQATEDGFVACTVCTPDAAAAAPAAGPLAPAGEGDVWVADGFPEYHRHGCAQLAGHEEIAIPRSQAVEDGFVACSVCTPDAESLPAVPPAAAAGAAAPAGESDVWVADGFPEYHRQGCAQLAGHEEIAIPRSQAVEDGFLACSVCTPDAESAPAVPPAAAAGAAAPAGESDVWVADGFPEYHRQGCAQLAGHEEIAIPRSQAVEDGFVACSVCTPDAESAPTAVPPPVQTEPGPAQVSAGDVWVVDGFPDYHRAGCVELIGQAAEPIPLAQAVEDGFGECRTCTPQSAGTPAEPPAEPAGATATSGPSGDLPSATAGEVWVVDGYPNYHRADCVELVGQAAEPVPHDQAVEDGFAECQVCTPESTEAAGAAAAGGEAAVVGAPQGLATQFQYPGGTPVAETGGAPRALLEGDVLVADGFPEFHRADCPAAAGLGPLIPLARQEALDSGFAACAVCNPGGEGAVPAQPAATGEREVVVVDGYPSYHRAGCTELAGLEQIPVPYDQAVEDGFAACPVCRPDDEEAPVPPAETGVVAEVPAGDSVGVAAEVYVVDGYPDYHRAGCSQLAGLDDEPVAHDQAVEDGFAPCAVCRPEDATPPPAEPEPVAQKEPEAEHVEAEHVEPEAEHVEHEAEHVEPEADHAEPEAENAEPEAEPEPAQPAQEPELEAPPELPAAAEPSAEIAPVAEPEPAETQPPAQSAGTTTAVRVWVVDGRPRFHAQDCLIIKGQTATSVSRDQAEADGFLPCSLCQRRSI